MKLKKQFRAILASDMKVDENGRTVEISFSSEEPVDRYFGTEILSHDAGSPDFSRIEAGACPLLFNHDPDQLIGTVEGAWIQDKKGYAKIRFSESEDGEERLKQLQEGVLKNVSFGYMIKEIDQMPEQNGKPITFIAKDWEVFEISCVSVPADYSIGYGRDDEKLETEVKVNKIGEEKRETIKMSDKEKEIQPVDVKVVRGEAIAEERARISAISALGDKYKMKDLARQLIEGEKSVLEAREAIMEKVMSEQKPIEERSAIVGLSDKEIKEFDFRRALNALANPNDKKAQDAAAYEREVSEAACKKTGQSSRGILVPIDVLRGTSKRDLTVGSSTAGGNLVSTNLLAGSFIELLRNKSVVQSLGATVLNGLVGQVAIPRMTSGATAYWVAESGAPTEGAEAFDQVTMSPKTVGAFVDYSRKLLLQSSIDVGNMIKADLAQVLALEIDRASLYGSGSSNEPTGLKNISGINTVDFAANTPTWLEMIQLETEVAADNADIGSLAYLVNATGRGALKGVAKATNQAIFAWENDSVNGYKAVASNQVASNDFWFGNWKDLLLGFWSGLDLTVDPYAGATSGTVRIIALQDMDIAVRHPVSFCRGNNTL